MKLLFENKIVFLFLLALIFVLTGCGNEEDFYPSSRVYKITVVNMTYNQLFSPVIAIFHTAGYKAWEEGKPASEEIERFAEGGEAEPRVSGQDGKWLLTEAANDPAVIVTGVSALDGVKVGPGGGGQLAITLSVPPDDALRITVLASLWYTNDGFTGTTDLGIGHLGIGQSLSVLTDAFDAGTEKNTESKETVPGPEFLKYEEDEEGNLVLDDNGDFIPIEGVGYKDENDDIDIITVHTGVITKDETIPDKIKEDSALDESHRFQQPVAKITVERLL